METLPTRILIIEDNSDDVILLLRQLKVSQLTEQVRVIADGRSALDYLTGEDCPLQSLIAVFLDLKIPALGGLELLARIRGTARLQHLPVIVMTSSNSPEDLERCRSLGVSSYVSKPISLTAFTKAVADTFHAPTGFTNTARLMQDSRQLLLKSTRLNNPAKGSRPV